MKRNPIFLGILVFCISLVAWVISIIFNVITLGAFRWVSNAFITVAMLSLPVAFLWKLASRSFKKK